MRTAVFPSWVDHCTPIIINNVHETVFCIQTIIQTQYFATYRYILKIFPSFFMQLWSIFDEDQLRNINSGVNVGNPGKVAHNFRYMSRRLAQRQPNRIFLGCQNIVCSEKGTPQEIYTTCVPLLLKNTYDYIKN